MFPRDGANTPARSWSSPSDLSRVEYQLPNLVVGAITKESIYGAFENGITAEQIRLWETDRNRVEEWFEQCCDHARDHGYLLWEDSRRMRLIVRGEFHSEMREFLRRQR
nr:unnamed protein product [Digitaria exilis]